MNILTIATSGINVFTILIAILVLLFMVTVHEFGHYITGKKLGFKITEFSIGFGPALYKRKTKSGEQFSIRLFPLGGYCAFLGEDESSDAEGSFEKQAPWKRIIVLVSGALMNFLSTLVIVILTFSLSGQYVLTASEILPNDEGETITSEYILQKDDMLLSVNGNTIYMTSDLSTALINAAKTPEKPLEIEVIREGERKTVSVYLRDYTRTYKNYAGETVTIDANGLGILQSSVLHRFGFFENIGRATAYCFKIAGTIFAFLGQLLTGAVGISSLGGPVTTISMTAEIASYGFRQLLEIVALIGVNLAVFNLLPIPALDGSKVVFTIIEWIRKKPVNKNVEAVIHFVGFIALIGFAILVDVLKYV